MAPVQTTPSWGLPPFNRASKMAFLSLATFLIFIWSTSSLRHPRADNAQKSTAMPGQDIAEVDRVLADRLAIVIETETTPNLIPLMLHFSSVLGSGWPLVLFTLKEHWKFPDSIPFRRAVDTGRIHIRFLPPKTDLSSSLAVSRFLTNPWFWEHLQVPYRVLLFQTDSIICSKAGITVDDFLNYDFVGAPIHHTYGSGFNGGLSLRNPKLFLRIAQEYKFDDTFEDQWFYEKVKELGGTMPEEEVAKTFAVETIDYPTPIGFHQPQRWQKPHMSEIDDYCPEVRLLGDRRAT